MPIDPPVSIHTPLSGAGADAPAAVHSIPAAPVDGIEISGVVTAGVNGKVYPAGLLHGKPHYTSDGLPVDVTGEDPWDGPVVFCTVQGLWTIALYDSTYFAQKSSPASSTPIGLTGWNILIGTGQPVIADSPGLAAPPAIHTP